MTTKIAVPTPRIENRMMLRDPLDLFADIEREMYDMFNTPWPTMFRPLSAVRNIERQAWIPRLDAYELNGELVVHCDLPGMKKEDVHVELDENDLVIRGERIVENKIERDNYLRSERSVGTFLRRLPLTFAADPKLIKANFKDGVLEIKLPLPVEAKKEVKKIAVV
jgi:HSP20 family protein